MPVFASNRFLDSLSDEALSLLLSGCTELSLPVRTPLYEPGHIPEYAVFLTSGIASVVTPMMDGGTAEVEIIGYEGLVGSHHLLGPSPIPTTCFMQVSGSGLQVKMARLKAGFANSLEIRNRVLELVQCQTSTISQIAGCNRLHDTEARLARWLLMAQDRTRIGVLYLTQEFLAQMLGTQRTTVTTTAGLLQRSGLITYRQGEVTIVDRAGLENAACECYGIVKRLHSGLYASPWA